jgi:hypothetical protein
LLLAAPGIIVQNALNYLEALQQLEAIDVIANQGRTLVIKQPEYLYSLLPPGLIGHLT